MRVLCLEHRGQTQGPRASPGPPPGCIRPGTLFRPRTLFLPGGSTELAFNC